MEEYCHIFATMQKCVLVPPRYILLSSSVVFNVQLGFFFFLNDLQHDLVPEKDDSNHFEIWIKQFK